MENPWKIKCKNHGKHMENSMGNPWEVHGKSMENKIEKRKCFRGTSWGPHGGPWGPMGPHEESWVLMGPHGFPWVPMGSHGSPWVPWDPMGPHGVPWGPHGVPMASMENPRMSEIMDFNGTHYSVRQNDGSTGSISIRNMFPLHSVMSKRPESPHGAKKTNFDRKSSLSVFRPIGPL